MSSLLQLQPYEANQVRFDPNWMEEILLEIGRWEFSCKVDVGQFATTILPRYVHKQQCAHVHYFLWSSLHGLNILFGSINYCSVQIVGIFIIIFIISYSPILRRSQKVSMFGSSQNISVCVIKLPRLFRVLIVKVCRQVLTKAIRALHYLVIVSADLYGIQIVWNRETAVLMGVMAVAGGLLGGYTGGRMGAAIGAGIGTATGYGISSMYTHVIYRVYTLI